MIAFLALLYGGLHGHAGDRRPRPLPRRVPGPAPFAITIVPAIFGAVVIVLFLGSRCLPATSTGWSGAGPPAGAGPQRLAVRLAAASATAATGMRTAIALVRARDPYSARRGRLVGVRHRGAVGVLPRVRRLAAQGRDRDVLLRRDARQHAAAAGRDRRRRRRHDRRVHGVRRRRRVGRSSRCSPTGRSRSGCRRSRARSPTCSCGARSIAGAPRRPACSRCVRSGVIPP